MLVREIVVVPAPRDSTPFPVKDPFGREMFPVPVTVPVITVIFPLAVIFAPIFQLPPEPLNVRLLKVIVPAEVILFPDVVAFISTVVLAGLNVAEGSRTRRPPTVSVVLA